MRYSTSMRYLLKKYSVTDAVRMYMDAGYTALDVSMVDTSLPFFSDGYRKLASEMLEIANSGGVIFNQAHAPFVSKTDKYEKEILPLMPRVFEMSSLLGIKNTVFHTGFMEGVSKKDYFKENADFLFYLPRKQKYMTKTPFGAFFV